MGRKRQNTTEFTVLDAIRLAVVPEKDRVSAIAAHLIADGQGLPAPLTEAVRIAQWITNTTEEENNLVDEVMVEVRRQLRIKIDRMDSQRRLRQSLRMGSRLPRSERINRVCKSIFGEPTTWMPVGKVEPVVSDPRFTWMHSTEDALVVAGVDGVVGSEAVTGFVFYDRRSGPVRFGRLPRKTKDIADLCVVLGLHPRLLENKEVKIDWRKRAFIVAGTNHLPWVYP